VNVVISAALWGGGRAADALRLALRISKVIVSTELVDEYAEVFARTKFDRYLDPALRTRFLAEFLDQCHLVETGPPTKRCRDADDDHVLELCVTAKAILISGDRDLTDSAWPDGIKVLSPSDFLDQYSNWARTISQPN